MLLSDGWLSDRLTELSGNTGEYLLYKGIGDGQNGHGGKPPWHVTNDLAYFSQRNVDQAIRLNGSPLFHVGARPRETGNSKEALK